MPRTRSRPLWLPVHMAGHHFQSLNLDHPSITAHVNDDMGADIDVYYNRRWDVTERFCRFLLSEPEWVADRAVLVLGAGVGLETVVVGRLCRHLYVNDHAPGALALCARQLRHNGVTDFVCLPGRYERLLLPAVDLVVGSFLVYNPETMAAMQQLLERCRLPVLLMNDPMPEFQRLMRETTRPVRSLLPPEDAPCVVFDAPSAPAAPGETRR